MVRVEAQKLVDDTYQQLLLNKDWVKQLKVLYDYIAVTISFNQWLRVGVQKYVDATFLKFGDAEASDRIRQKTFSNKIISIYLFRQLMPNSHASDRVPFISANAETGTYFLVRHNVTNQYIVVEGRDGKFIFEGVPLSQEQYSPIMSWKEGDSSSEKKRQKRQELPLSGRTQQTQPLWETRSMEEATPPPRPYQSQPQPPPSYAPTHRVRDKLYFKDNYPACRLSNPSGG